MGQLILVRQHAGCIRAVCELLLGLTSAALVPVAPGSMTVLDGNPLRLLIYNLAPLAGSVVPSFDPLE